MITSSIAKEYAKALFLLARRTDKIDIIDDELDSFTRLVESHKMIKHFLLAPQLSTETKVEVLKKVLSGKVDDDFLRFLLVLVTKRRQDFLAAINAAYKTEVNKYYNRIEVEVEAAVELTPKERDTLRDRLARHFKQNVVIRAFVNPSLLGGLICRIGDMVYDGSLRQRMQRLSNQMLKAKV